MDFQMKIDGKLNIRALISPKIQRISCSHNFRTTLCWFPSVLKMQK